MNYGVVSEQVAAQMARGVAKTAESNVGVGITGIAGPGGGTAKKPVGMVCFGFCVQDQVQTYTCQFGNLGRNRVRESAVKFVFPNCWRFCKTGSAVLFLRGSCDFSLDFLREI